MAARVKKDDLVEIISGKDRGKRGKVLSVIPKSNEVIVEGLNVVKRHLKAGTSAARQSGGIITKESPLDASKVMWVCPECDKPTRVGFRVLDDGTKERVCKQCQ